MLALNLDLSGSVAPIAPQNFTINCPPVGNELLSALWRSPNLFHQIGALDRRTKQFRNIQVSGISDAVRRALALSDAGTEAYFACAEYLTPNTREAANVSGAGGFWMDLDCGEEKAAAGKGYLNVIDAQQAVRQFCKDVGLPEPTHIVYSGGGLHVYWVLDCVVDREIWQTYAGKLKALTKARGFLADGSRTADIASVLRMPGTLNHKYVPPRLVTLLYAADTFIEYSAMLAAIGSAHSQLCNAVAPPRSICPTEAWIPKNIALTSGRIRLLQVIVRHIDADRCYDDWLHVGMALHFETGGRDKGFALFDAWSSTGTKYKGTQETETKWRSFRSDLENAYTIRTLIWMAKQEDCTWETICAEAEPFGICEDQNGTV